MHEIKPAVVVDDTTLTVPIPFEAASAINEWHEAHTEELAKLLAPFGLHPYDIALPQYERVVTREELGI